MRSGVRAELPCQVPRTSSDREDPGWDELEGSEHHTLAALQSKAREEGRQ